MDSRRFIILITKYLSKEASIKEIEELNLCLEDKEYKELFEKISIDWENKEKAEDSFQFNYERGLGLLRRKMNESLSSSIKATTRKKLKNIFNNYIFKIATSVALVALLSFGIYLVGTIHKFPDGESAYKEKVTEAGQKSIITLIDGTEVTLNADSKLRFQANFQGKTREVYLEGEAYFEVVHDSTMPFIVHSGNFNVTVLGTEFDVKAFPGENNYSVSLVKGKAKVTSEKEKTNLKEVILHPDQQYEYNNATGQAKVGNFNELQVTGWKENILIFDNASLGEAFIQLERAYGVKFNLEDKSLSNIKIKANFKNASFWTIVKVIQSATNLDYRTVSGDNKELKEIMFYKKSKIKAL